MSKKISIFRNKVNEEQVINSDLVFTTGDKLSDILNAIRPYADNCTIYLHGCEKMYHFRATLADNFPNAIIRHKNVDLETL